MWWLHDHVTALLEADRFAMGVLPTMLMRVIFSPWTLGTVLLLASWGFVSQLPDEIELLSAIYVPLFVEVAGAIVFFVFLKLLEKGEP